MKLLIVVFYLLDRDRMPDASSLDRQSHTEHSVPICRRHTIRIDNDIDRKLDRTPEGTVTTLGSERLFPLHVRTAPDSGNLHDRIRYNRDGNVLFPDAREVDFDIIIQRIG